MFFIINFSDSKPPTLSINQPWVDSETNIVSIWSQHICGKQECVNSHPIWSHLIAFRTFIQKKSSQKSTSLVAGCLLSPKRSAALSPLRIILGIPKKESESSQGSIWTSPGVFFLEGKNMFVSGVVSKSPPREVSDGANWPDDCLGPEEYVPMRPGYLGVSGLSMGNWCAAGLKRDLHARICDYRLYLQRNDP